MKNSIKSIIAVAALSTTIVFTSFAEGNKVTDAKNLLPVSIPVVESPAPEKTKQATELKTYSPAQKAAIVELKFEKNSK
ncbi:hypothetical protein [Dyadobacter helix]|nr:hypothetical protein [Dyadobacter sp. CECT 9275]